MSCNWYNFWKCGFILVVIILFESDIVGRCFKIMLFFNRVMEYIYETALSAVYYYFIWYIIPLVLNQEKLNVNLIWTTAWRILIKTWI